jgi:hypothetical protein
VTNAKIQNGEISSAKLNQDITVGNLTAANSFTTSNVCITRLQSSVTVETPFANLNSNNAVGSIRSMIPFVGNTSLSTVGDYKKYVYYCNLNADFAVITYPVAFNIPPILTGSNATIMAGVTSSDTTLSVGVAETGLITGQFTIAVEGW